VARETRPMRCVQCPRQIQQRLFVLMVVLRGISTGTVGYSRNGSCVCACVRARLCERALACVYHDVFARVTLEELGRLRIEPAALRAHPRRIARVAFLGLDSRARSARFTVRRRAASGCGGAAVVPVCPCGGGCGCGGQGAAERSALKRLAFGARTSWTSVRPRRAPAARVP
jgi:hypothetical protein